MADDIVERLRGMVDAYEERDYTKAACHVSETADEISRLREEMAATIREGLNAVAEMRARTETAESQVATLRERVKELEEGLRPFAEARVSSISHPEPRCAVVSSARPLCLANFRKAASLLTNQEQG